MGQIKDESYAEPNGSLVGGDFSSDIEEQQQYMFFKVEADSDLEIGQDSDYADWLNTQQTFRKFRNLETGFPAT